MYHKNILPIYILSFFSFQYSISQKEDYVLSCFNSTEIFSKSDNDLISYIKQNINSLVFKSSKCIDVLVNYGKIDVLDSFLSELSKKKIRYREDLEMSINQMRKQIDEVHNKHRYDESDFQEIFPASQWAQSLDDIFIEIKFAHRHDSPGCLEIKDLKVNIREKFVTLTGKCFLDDVPVKINYHIKLLNKINIKESTHGTTSVGRYRFSLRKKKTNDYWKKLLDDKMTIPRNMRVWFEMKDKYQDQLNQYEKEHEQAQDYIDQIMEASEDIRKEREKEKKGKNKPNKSNKSNKKKKNKKKKAKKTGDL